MTSYLDNIITHDIITSPTLHTIPAPDTVTGTVAATNDWERNQTFFDTQTELGKKPHERCVTPHIPHSNLLAKCAFTLFVWYFETKKNSLGELPLPNKWQRLSLLGRLKNRFSQRTDIIGYPTPYNTLQYRDPRMQGIHKRTAERDSACNWR